MVTWMGLSWAMRLMWYLVRRLLYRHRHSNGGRKRDSSGGAGDERIDTLIDSKWWKAIGWWTGQAMWVAMVSFPLVACNLSHREDQRGFWTAWDRYGSMVWLVGWVMEGWADEQRFLFNATPASLRQNPFINWGLWAYSRHPNYCGEFLCWLGIWMVSQPVHTTATSLLSFLSSPLFTILLLTKISGIPISEAKDDRRFGRLPAYLQYKYVTSPFFPIPPSLYAQLEAGVRKYFLFESFQPKVRRVKRTLMSNSLASSPNK
jgi:steroid 5-alpha reductase family enzyme